MGAIDEAQRPPSARPFRRNRTLNFLYRLGVALLGTLIVLIGLALIPLPGPGWLIVFAGLALLATEFAWASRLLSFARTKALAWTTWATRQSLLIRGALGLLGLAVLAGLALLYAWRYGVPGWLPIE